MPVSTGALESMPKQQTRRIVSVAAVSFATLGIAFGWQAPSGVDRMSGSVAILEQDDFGERQGALLFLKAALDRLDTDAKQTAPDDPALRSLRAERDAVRLRMREVASPLPAESLPRELGFLKDEPHVAVGPTPVPDTATGIAIPPELKVGLASTSPATDIALSRDPDLNPVILVLSPRPATKSTADNIAKFPSAHDVWRAVQWH
jgi:hypothetical protein